MVPFMVQLGLLEQRNRTVQKLCSVFNPIFEMPAGHWKVNQELKINEVQWSLSVAWGAHNYAAILANCFAILPRKIAGV